MPSGSQTITIATRGSALALAQANYVLNRCRAHRPDVHFVVRIIKTTGDKLQTAKSASEAANSVKGLFTKELEVALLDHTADLAVHSLKDLPTDLPPGLCLGAVCPRADARDVLLYRADVATAGAPSSAGRTAAGGLTIAELPPGATVATSSTRRAAQLLEHRSDLKIVPIRGNVPTRLKKLSEQRELDATILAMAGLNRLHYQVDADHRLLLAEEAKEPRVAEAGPVPTSRLCDTGLLATVLETELVLPCVGQAAIGIEIRENDALLSSICDGLNDLASQQCVAAERAFLQAMGGGCQSPVAALAEIVGDNLRLRAVSFKTSVPRRFETLRPRAEAAELGRAVAAALGV